MDDADLDAVTEQVDSIQQNIRALFEPEPEPDLDEVLDDDDGSAAESDVESATVTPISAEVAGSPAPDAEDPDRTG